MGAPKKQIAPLLMWRERRSLPALNAPLGLPVGVRTQDSEGSAYF
jgi:hypothetical protein